MHVSISVYMNQFYDLTHWGRLTNICVDNLTIIGSDNSLLPGRRQTIIWTNAGLFLIGPLETNFSEILIEIFAFPLQEMYMKTSSTTTKWWPFCLGLNVITYWSLNRMADILQTTFRIFNCIFLKGKFCDLIKISLNLWSRSQLSTSQHWLR